MLANPPNNPKKKNAGGPHCFGLFQKGGGRARQLSFSFPPRVNPPPLWFGGFFLIFFFLFPFFFCINSSSSAHSLSAHLEIAAPKAIDYIVAMYPSIPFPSSLLSL